MTFIAPWAGATALALGAPVLVALYLLRLRRRALRVSSTLLWDRAVQDLQVNVPLRWLRLSLPLVLQALALLSLATSLARPVFNPLTGTGAGRVVLLIDRSAVMNASDGAADAGRSTSPATRLDEARRRALQTLDSLRRAGTPPEVMVVQFAHSAQVLAPWTTDLPTLREAVESITPTDQPANLSGALKLLEPFALTSPAPQPGTAALAGREPDAAQSPTTAPPEVLIFSSGPPPTAFDSPPGGEPILTHATTLSTRLIRIGPAGASPRRNLGIIALSARRENDDPATLRLFARIASAAPQPEETTLRVSFAGRPPQLLPITVPAASGNTPGETTATLAINETAGGTLVCELPGGDALAADDTAALIISPAVRPRVLIVGPPGTGDQPRQAIDPFLLSALAATEPATLETLDPPGLDRLIASGRLAALFDLVVLDRVRTELPIPPSVSTLSVACVPRVAGVEWSLSERDGSPATRCLAWERTHPVLRHAPLDSLYVSPALRLTARTTPTPAGDTPTVEPLAEGEAGPLIVAARLAAARHLVVCFDLARSNWGPDASFPVFVSAAADWLTGRAEAQAGHGFTTTQAIPLSPEPGATAVRLERLGTPAAPTPPAARDAGQGGPVSIGPVERSGLFRVIGARAMPGSGDLIAVNAFDPWATALGASDALPWSGAIAAPTAGRTGPREVWHWFLLAALAASTVEWFVYAWRMRG